jgi:hypothetical protein
MTDMELRREVDALTDRIHELLAQRRDEESGGTSRIVLNVPDEWMLLAAWLEMRRRMRLAGRHGPSPLPAQELGVRTIRSLARHSIIAMLDSEFHLELHDLSMGGHPFLTPPTELPRKIVNNPDDELPF